MARSAAQESRRCDKRPKGAGNLPPGDPRRSFMTRRCKQGNQAKKGTEGGGVRFERGGIYTSAPRSRKNPATPIGA